MIYYSKRQEDKDDMEYIIYIIIGIVLFMIVSGIIAMLIITKPIGEKVYHEQLVRTGPNKWGRVCSEPSNEEQLSMWNTGIEWAKAHSDIMEEVEVENDGLKLYGEYYNFGGDSCAIILPGRCESLMYSYYFALPYEKLGMNVLVIDQRAHGNSEGMYSTIGVKESGDVLKWIELIQNKYGINNVWFHGICVGTATAILVMTSKDCPSCVKGLVTEGCFVSFRETFKRHMVDINKPWFPVLDLVMMNVKKYGKANVYKAAPIRHIAKLRQHILMIYGKQDIFSVPHKSEILYNKCKSSTKEIVWFEKGGHSHLRINNTEEYDKAIINYITGK
jgi:pimeloyl-ACP methyl ester carboxylesterase